MRGAKLVNWGSFDIDNFGDLLFPFLVEHHLGRRYDEIVHASPTGTRSVWPDARSTLTITDALARGGVGALLVGGGNLISWTRSSSKNYAEDPFLADIVHKSFSLVPYILRSKFRIPYAYNYVGVTKTLPPSRHSLVKAAVETASYISCRDEASVRHLQACGVTRPIALGFDSAIGISAVFDRAALRDHYNSHVKESYGIPNVSRLATIHVKRRYLDSQFVDLDRVIRAFELNGLHVVCLPLGLCHGDDEVLADVRFGGHSATVIHRPKTLRDMLSILSVAEYSVGSSLHGAIVSLSYGNAVGLIADEERSGLWKFSGLLSQVGLSSCLFKTWADAAMVLESIGPSALGGVDPRRLARLGGHEAWDSINERLRASNSVGPSLVSDAEVRACVTHYGL
jgi:lipopolysaccharide transport system ATP-binding protein